MNKTRFGRIRQSIAALGLMIPLLASPLIAQSPTPEGTVITNTATATFTDANNNTYDPASASVSITVGFLAGINVTGPATAAPASPSTGNVATYTVTNQGNGLDTFIAAFSPSAGITITAYRIGATEYATLAELNTALAATDVAAGANLEISAVYNVAPGQGGQNLSLNLEIQSGRDNTTSDDHTISILPPVDGGVTVVALNNPTSELASPSTPITASFTVNNTGNATALFNLTTDAGTYVTVTSVNGTAGTSGTVTVAANTIETVVVEYTLQLAPLGTSTELELTATHDDFPATTDSDELIINVIRPALTVAKQAFRNDQTTLITGADEVLPGEFVQYRIAVTNDGSAIAEGIQIVDILPSEVIYDSVEAGGPGWIIDHTAGTVTATFGDPIGIGTSQYFWIRVQIR
jgi:uncharacterized repeat protein (TIGR01451 family)